MVNKKDFIFLISLGNEFWNVEYIYGKKIDHDRPKYYTKWLGFSKEESTWEPMAHLVTAFGYVENYEETQSRSLFLKKIKKDNKPISKNENLIQKETNIEAHKQQFEENSSQNFQYWFDKENTKKYELEIDPDIFSNEYNMKQISERFNGFNEKYGFLIEEKKSRSNFEEEILTNEFSNKRVIGHKYKNIGDRTINNAIYKIQNNENTYYNEFEEIKLNDPLLLIEYLVKNALLIN